MVEELPETEVQSAELILAALVEAAAPRMSLVEATFDHEGEDSDEERRAVEEARAEADRGELIPHDEVRRRWGLAEPPGEG